MRRIALIGCSAKKHGKNNPRQEFLAKDIYLGNNYKKAKDFGIDFFDCEKEFFILSGKYGLLAADDKICYYNTYLGKFREAQKREWAEMVLSQLKAKFDIKNTEFVIFAGSSYSKYIKNHLNCIVLKFNNRAITFEIKEKVANGGK